MEGRGVGEAQGVADPKKSAPPLIIDSRFIDTRLINTPLIEPRLIDTPLIDKIIDRHPIHRQNY
jgi:hypothetical protein